MPLHPTYEGLKEDNKKVSQVLMHVPMLGISTEKISIHKGNHKRYVENKYVIIFFSTGVEAMRHIHANFLMLVLYVGLITIILWNLEGINSSPKTIDAPRINVGEGKTYMA
jgi:hypothetical protein